MFKKSLLCGAALVASVAVCIAAGAAGAAGAGAQEGPIPNFAFTDSGWLLNGGIDFRPMP